MLTSLFLQSTTGDASFPARYSPDFVQPPSGNYPFVFDNLFVKTKRKEPPRNESAPNLSESYDKVCKRQCLEMDQGLEMALFFL